VLTRVDSVGEKSGVLLRLQGKGVEGRHLQRDDLNFDWPVYRLIEGKVVDLMVYLLALHKLLFVFLVDVGHEKVDLPRMHFDLQITR
jgi:hypothetical protein